MSVRPRDRHNLELANAQENKIKTNISNIVDNINCNNLTRFYPKDESLFKKRIDKLNLKFYIETEKYLINKNDPENMERSMDQLFIILFKQISLYIEEIERLNFVIIREKDEDEKMTKEKIDELNKKEKEQTSNQMMITNLKTNMKNLEKKLEDKTKSEEKIKNENESLKRQIKFYKDKLQIDLVNKKTQVVQIKQNRNFDDMNSSILSGTNEVVLRSNSKESFAKKVSASVTGTVNTYNTAHTNNTNILSYNSLNQEKEIIKLANDLDSKPNNTNSNNKLLTTNNNMTNNINSSSNFNENLTMSKIMNKKRNYSDNNPSQIKKNINIVSVSINNRYNDPQSQNNCANNISGKVNIIMENEKIKREITRSSMNPKIQTMKSPEKLGILIHNGDNSVKKLTLDNNKTMYKNLSKNPKDYKIIKSIKQLKEENNDSHETPNKNEEKLKSPKSSSNFITRYSDHYLYNPNTAQNSSGTYMNENLTQDQLLTAFNSYKEELDYLNELEKIVSNTKIDLLDINNSYSNNESYNQNTSNINKISNLNNLKTYEEIGKRSESVENTAGHALVFSEEEVDGYNSGASCFSDKQQNFTKNTQQTSTNKLLSGNSKLLINSKINNNIKTKPVGYTPLSSVTIDLMKKEKSKNNINIIKAVPTIKKVEVTGILNKVKNK